jgi:hypothetical protein
MIQASSTVSWLTPYIGRIQQQPKLVNRAKALPAQARSTAATWNKTVNVRAQSF